MENSIFTQLLLPAALAFIMLGMGLSLIPQDFYRLFKAPKGVILGLLGQLICLPLCAFMLATIFNAPPHIAIGMMILAACPGGTSSNLFSHIARANLALSVTLTAITTVVCVFSTPWLIKYSISYFSMGEAVSFSLLKTSLGLIVISLLPVCIGMMLRHRYPSFALRSESLFRKLAMLFMVLVIVGVVIKERQIITEAFPDVFLYALLLNASATLMGVIIGKLGKLPKKDGVTLGIEIGTQNGTMAILIAISFIQDPTLSIAPAVYGITMYLGACALVLYGKALR